jgi:hypothetical protein
MFVIHQLPPASKPRQDREAKLLMYIEKVLGIGIKKKKKRRVPVPVPVPVPVRPPVFKVQTIAPSPRRLNGSPGCKNTAVALISFVLK